MKRAVPTWGDWEGGGRGERCVWGGGVGGGWEGVGGVPWVRYILETPQYLPNSHLCVEADAPLDGAGQHGDHELERG